MTPNDSNAPLQVGDAPREWLGRFTADELTNEDYHEAPGVSKSHLDIIDGSSPRHYWQRYLNPERPVEEPTDALRVGNAIHAAILQPNLFESRYAAAPKVDKRTTIGKEAYAAFKRGSVGKEELSAIEFKLCLEMRDAVHAHPVARGLLMHGTAEHSFFCTHAETGELIKCRTDYVTDDGDMVVDLKSTTDASPHSFARDAGNYRYDLAPPWYFDVIGAVTGRTPRNWVWLAVEKEPPYAIGIYYAQKHDIIRARDTARRNFLQILHHRRLNAWPDYGEVVRPLEMPAYIKR